MNDIYDRIDFKLNEKKLTKKQMCSDLQIPYSTLTSFYQTRSGNMTLSTIKKIANYLDTTMDWLVNGNVSANEVSLSDNIYALLILNDKNKTQKELSEIESELVKAILKLSVQEKVFLLTKVYELISKRGE